MIAELSAKIGEKLELRRVAYFDGTVETYLHKRAADLPPGVGVLVEYTGGDADAAHAVALQIAALKARYLTRDDVPEDVVASERRIAEETSRAEGKPEQALPKIVEGRLGGFFKDVVLLEQPSVSDSKKTVKALLDEAGVTVTRFVRFEVGQQSISRMRHVHAFGYDVLGHLDAVGRSTPSTRVGSAGPRSSRQRSRAPMPSTPP